MDEPEERIRLFLMRWVMEFGTDYVTSEQRHASLWWCKETITLGRTPALDPYSEQAEGHEGVRINQAGLDLIKGG